jgi:hypothetical protein
LSARSSGIATRGRDGASRALRVGGEAGTH